ncbi:IucA/IucC family protein [Chenggangzhangella methanolivorans]|uniref:Siderophore synthetase component n=1 Tax=Chenggangzhangella methanolivorans TaxID=1437009 RepID=A0A9E6R8T9_9HYPH|nr:IucA/IucC family protein [Chenggangzhangella methanolivorans]QZN98737.1 hypothetical protein K6K41_17340 [Chenggangzhangella methanolivorans]
MDPQAKTRRESAVPVRSSRQAAEQATFQSFANCYLREIDPGVATRHTLNFGHAVDAVELALPAQRASLRIELLGASLCGPHRLGRAFLKRALEPAWREVEPLAALQALLHEAYRRPGKEASDEQRGCELELLSRVLDSYRATERYLDAPRAEDEDDFLASEQSLTFGHWLHPTPKSRQGMTTWQQPAYSPELRGAFQLDWFAAPLERVSTKSAARESVAEIVAGIAGEDFDRLGARDGEALIPMHPLQAQALLLDPELAGEFAGGALRHLGPAGPEFSATASVRTVYRRDADWMLKFSLPVRITNSVRRNRRHELDAGVAMAGLFERSDFLVRHPRFRVLRDPAYVTVDVPGLSESGFETIFRENPFRGEAASGVATIAALSADPRPGETSRLERIVGEIAAREGRDASVVAREWFAAYLDCALDPLVALYDELGVALEAHQQNALIGLRDGWPAVSWYRDSQGYYLSNAYRETLRAIAPETEGVAHLFYDDAAIQDPFAYYLVVNQIFSVVSRMGHDGLVHEAELVGLLRERLEALSLRLSGAGRVFVDGLLRRSVIAAKSNLMTRLLNIDELASGDETARYQRLPNPIAGFAAGEARGGQAVAV